jgi:hypothetical protein
MKSLPFLCLLILPLLVGPVAAESPEEKLKSASQQIVTEAFGQLSAALAAAIAEGGPAHAIDVCGEKAPALAADLSEKHGVQLSRVSSKNRNPENAADEEAIKVLQAFADRLANQQGPQALAVRRSSGETAVYTPILLGNPLCLKCHGELGADVDAETAAALKKNYPEDLATGYQVGELRGAWRVVFPKP